MSQREIAVKVDCAHSTVHDTLIKYRETGDIEDRERTGRPHLVDISHSQTNVVTKAIEKDPQQTAAGIQQSLHSHNHINVSVRTVSRLRQALGYRPVLYMRVPLLDEERRKKEFNLL